jgi:hypothetical protein
MNFTFVRTERSQEENQERAFIAASRRQDRDFKQRLESLQKASELHFARTGKRFELTQQQVEHNGPLMELGDYDRRRESLRYQPYTVDRRGVNLRRDEGGGNFMLDTEQQHYDHFPHHQHVQPQVTFQQRERGIWGHQALIPTELEPSSQLPSRSIPVPEIDVVESQSQNEVEDSQNLDANDLHPSFFDLENWNYEYQEDLNSLDIQNYLDTHFPTPRQGTPDQDLHVNNQLEERTSPFVWTDHVHYQAEDTREEQAENYEGYG